MSIPSNKIINNCFTSCFSPLAVIVYALFFGSEYGYKSFNPLQEDKNTAEFASKMIQHNALGQFWLDVKAHFLCVQFLFRKQRLHREFDVVIEWQLV